MRMRSWLPEVLFYCEPGGGCRVDEELRDLERLAAANPGDARLVVRLARARARAGDLVAAAEALAHAVAVAPDDAEAMGELDRITRGGVDPGSPWPCESGDGRRS